MKSLGRHTKLMKEVEKFDDYNSDNLKKEVASVEVVTKLEYLSRIYFQSLDLLSIFLISRQEWDSLKKNKLNLNFIDGIIILRNLQKFITAFVLISCKNEDFEEGVYKTYHRLKPIYYWKGMNKGIHLYIK